MKKIIVILLAFLTFSAYGQAEYEKIALTENVATASTSKIVSQQPGTGELNYINATALPLSVEAVNALKLKSYLSTGLIKNGLVTTNADPTKFNITAGIGIISNFDDPENPTSSIINFPAFTGIIPTYLTTGNITYVAINSIPAVVMQATPFTNIQRRDLIALGAVIHSNLTTINLVNNISAPTNAGLNQLHDLMEAIGALNISGNKYAGNGNLTINKSAGVIFKLGVNFANNWKDPNNLYLAPQSALTFRYRTQNGTEGLDVTNIDPSVYDLNNVLTAVPVNRFSIQTVTLFQTGQTRIQYGQTTYATMAEAEAAIITRAYNVESNIAANGITRAYIIVRHNATDLLNTTTSKIIEAQKFGGVASGGVALTDSAIIAALGFTPENVANKQNSLIVDGTGTKYPTVDAVNSGLALKSNLDTSGKLLTSEINNSDGNLGQILNQNLIDKTSFTSGFFVNWLNGVLSENVNYSATDFIEIIPNKKYRYIQKTGGSGNIYGAWFTAEGVYISGIQLTTGISDALLTAPVGAYKIRLSYSNTVNINNFFFYKALKLSTYGDSITAQNSWQPTLSKFLSLYPVVAGFSGATISGAAIGALNNDSRLNTLPTDTDVLLFSGGTNDWAQNIALGSSNSLSITDFYGALNVTMQKLKIRCPNAIIVILPTTYGEAPGRVGFSSPKGEINTLGLKTYDYANAMIAAAKNNNLKYIRTDKIWDTDNISFFVTNDGYYLHPNTLGGELMASKISLDLVQTVLDFNTNNLFNPSNFQPILTNPVTGSGVSGQLSYWDSSTTQTGSTGMTWDTSLRRFKIFSDLGDFFRSQVSTIGSTQYQSWYNSAGIRRGLLGYIGFSSSTLSIKNEDSGGNIELNTSSGQIYSNSAIIAPSFSGPLIGNASSATIWNGRTFGGEQSTTNSYFMTSATTSTWNYSSNAQVKTQLGLGTNAYTSTSFAPIDNAALTGTPTAPTATVGTNTTQIATTAFVQAANGTFVADAITDGITTIAPSQNAVSDALALKANLSGGTNFTGQVNATSFNPGSGNYTLSTGGTGLVDGVLGASFTMGFPTIGWNSNTVINSQSFVATGGTIRLKNYTVATLPAGTQGDTAYVTDATAPTYLGTLTGGGSVVCPVFFDGVSWKSH